MLVETALLLALAVPGATTTFRPAADRAPTADDGRPTHFVGVNVVPMHERGTILRDAVVSVVDNRVIYVGAASGARIADGDRVVRGGGAWLVPGLTEMHGHIPPVANETWPIDDLLRLFVAHGVTSVRGMLGHPSHLGLREELNSGARIGPRLVTSGPSLNGNTAPDPETGQRLVREQAAAGYDFLKIHPGLSLETYEAIASAAREVGIEFAGHVPYAVGLETALQLGQSTIDHLDGFAEKLLRPGAPVAGEPPAFFGVNYGGHFDDGSIARWARSTAEAGVWQVPTQALLHHVLGPMPPDSMLPGLRYVPSTTREGWANSRRQMLANEGFTPQRRADLLRVRQALIRAMDAAGVPILVGADAPQIYNVPGLSTLQEVRYLVDAGMDPWSALWGATAGPASFFGVGPAGTIQPGAPGDLVLVGGNPLDDPRHLEDIRGVMRHGVWYDRATLDEWLDDMAGRHAGGR
jgi:imidazolonepropionase-like amidohydrolase